MSKKLLIILVIIACIISSSSYIILSSETSIEDKTLLVGTYRWNGNNYQYTDEFTAIFTDHSMYKISFKRNSNDSYDSNTIIIEGENNTLSEQEIEGLIYVLNNTIPNNTLFSQYGFTIYECEKYSLSNDEYDILTTLIENSDFISLNETYPPDLDLPDTEINLTDLSWNWITIKHNDTYKRVTCYNYWPTSYREIWDTVNDFINTNVEVVLNDRK